MVLAEEDPFVPLKPEGSKAYPRGDGFDVRVLAWNVVSIKKIHALKVEKNRTIMSNPPNNIS